MYECATAYMHDLVTESLPRFDLKYVSNAHVRILPGPSSAWQFCFHTPESKHISAAHDLYQAESTIRDIKEWLTGVLEVRNIPLLSIRPSQVRSLRTLLYTVAE